MIFKAIETSAKFFGAHNTSTSCDTLENPDSLAKKALALALDMTEEEAGDFIWLHNGSTAKVRIWRPDTVPVTGFDDDRLSTIIERMLADSTPYSPANVLQTAVKTRRNLTNLEVSLEDFGAEIWWQISCHPLADSHTTLGIVRDITPAQAFCGELAATQARHNAAQLMNRHLTSALATSLRQQINVVANLSTVLPDQYSDPVSTTEDPLHNMADEMQQAVNELIMTGEMVRDFAEAITGSLQFSIENISVEDLLTCGLSGLVARAHKYGVRFSKNIDTGSMVIMADIQRTRMLIHVLVNLAASKATSDSMIHLHTQSVDTGFIQLCISYKGNATTAFDDTRQDVCDSDLLHPRIAQCFVAQVLEAHGAVLEFDTHNKDNHIIRLSLPTTLHAAKQASEKTVECVPAAPVMPASACAACKP